MAATADGADMSDWGGSVGAGRTNTASHRPSGGLFFDLSNITATTATVPIRAESPIAAIAIHEYGDGEIHGSILFGLHSEWQSCCAEQKAAFAMRGRMMRASDGD